MSTSQIVAQLKAEVPERKDATAEELLRRGRGGADHRCRVAGRHARRPAARAPIGSSGAAGSSTVASTRPAASCYPMGEERCRCHHDTAPLYLCRNCGADYLRLVGDPEAVRSQPSADRTTAPEWMIYEPGRFESVGARKRTTRTKAAAGAGKRSSGRGRSRSRSRSGPCWTARSTREPPRSASRPDRLPSAGDACARPDPLPLLRRDGGQPKRHHAGEPGHVGCGEGGRRGAGRGPGRGEQDRAGHDGKERLLIFSDSRQDAAHQARFIMFASRYDRMRRRIVKMLEQQCAR